MQVESRMCGLGERMGKGVSAWRIELCHLWPTALSEMWPSAHPGHGHDHLFRALNSLCSSLCVGLSTTVVTWWWTSFCCTILSTCSPCLLLFSPLSRPALLLGLWDEGLQRHQRDLWRRGWRAPSVTGKFCVCIPSGSDQGLFITWRSSRDLSELKLRAIYNDSLPSGLLFRGGFEWLHSNLHARCGQGCPLASQWSFQYHHCISHGFLLLNSFT